MGLFDNIFGRNKIDDSISFFSFTGDACTPAFTLDLKDYAAFGKAYDKCAALKTVINRSALAMSNGKWWLVDDKDNDVAKAYSGISALIAKPNPLQTFSELVMQMEVYRLLYGRVFVYASIPNGLDTQNAAALWAISPDHIEIEPTRRIYDQYMRDDIIGRIWLNAGGERRELDPRCVMIIDDVNRNIHFAPDDIECQSRLSALDYPVRNLIQAEEAIYAMNRNRGAFGILSSDNKDDQGVRPFKPSEKDELVKAFKQRYGLSVNQSMAIVTNANVKWQPITMSIKDLMVFEGVAEHVQTVCDVYDYPYELLGSTKGSTYANKAAAKKSYYEDVIIPFSKIYAEKFTEFFGLTNARFVIDFSEVGALKTAAAEAAKTFYQNSVAVRELFKLGLISAEEARLRLDFDEKIYGKTMYSAESGADQRPGDSQDQTEEE